MNRKIISILLSLTLLMSCMAMSSVFAGAADSYYINMEFEDVANIDELDAKSAVNVIHAGSNGSFAVSEMAGRGNVVESTFSAAPSDGNDRTNYIQFYSKPAIPLKNNSIAMEAMVYPTATGNQAIRLFEHTYSSGTQGWDALVVFQGGNIEGASGAMTKYSVNQWYHVLVVINSTDNPADRTYDVYVNDALVGSGLKRTGSFVTAESIDFVNVGYKSWAAGTVYFDDVKIYEYTAPVEVQYIFNEDFENVSNADELVAKPEINKVNKGSTGTVSIENVDGTGKVLKSEFSAKPSGDNYIQFYREGMSFVNNKVVMEAKVYPTATGNHAIRLFSHTWSGGDSDAWEPLVVFQNGNIEGASGVMTTYTVNQWYHVFVVVNSTANPAERTYDVYVNGNLVGSGLQRDKTFITTETIGFLKVGHRAWAAGYSYIDDIKVFEYPGMALESSSIADGQEDLSPNTNEINLKFASPIDSATLNGVKLADSDGNEVSITPELNSLDKSIMNITINDSLEGGEEYTLSFDGMADVVGSSFEGEISFTVAPMMIMTTVPSDGETDVSVDGDIILSFDYPVDPASFDKSMIEITGLTQDDFEAELTAENVITITLNRKLDDSKVYTVTLSDSICSTQATGYKKIFNKYFSFTTEVSDKFVDEFDNYVFDMYDYSKRPADGAANFTVSETSNNNVDNNVITLAYDDAPAYIIYHIEEGIRSFRLDKHVGNSQRPDKDGPVKIYVASEYDKETGIGNWQDVTPAEELIEVPGLATFLTAYKHEMTTGVPEGAKYLKVEINEPSAAPANVWSPELSKIQINHVLPVLKLVTTSPQIIDAGDWIKIDFTSAVKDTCLADAITVTDKDGTVLNIRDALLSDFSKRVKLEIAGGLDEYSEYTVTIDPEKLIGATGVAFTGNNVIVYQTGIKPYQLRAEFFSGTDTTQPALENMVGGTITVKGTVLSKEIDAQIIIARYNKDNEMVDIRTPDTFAKGDTVHPFSEAFTGCAATDTIKVFCLNGLDNVKPLGECKVLEPAQ